MLFFLVETQRKHASYVAPRRLRAGGCSSWQGRFESTRRRKAGEEKSEARNGNGGGGRLWRVRVDKANGRSVNFEERETTEITAPILSVSSPLPLASRYLCLTFVSRFGKPEMTRLEAENDWYLRLPPNIMSLGAGRSREFELYHFLSTRF